MDDLISRNEAAKRLEDLAKKREGSFSGEAFEFAAKVVRGVPAAEVPHWATEQAYKNGYEDGKPKWISVKDRLPENKSCILMYSADGGVAEGIYDKDQKRWIQFRWSVLNVPSVTHWMPLPPAPEDTK